jgi:23S rRNA pseudouridine1911/1915/1917 synthase
MQPLYEDNHLLAFFKPKGLLTQDSGTGEPNLEEMAKEWVKVHYQKKGEVFLHAVHRLDRPVSGIVLFARTSKSLSRLNAAMRGNKFVKIYRAWVEGEVPGEGVLVSKLSHGEKKAFFSEDGKLSELKYKTLEVAQGKSHVEIQLQTGRYHQIRAQFQQIGHPIIGDAKYGSRFASFEGGIALCHTRLEFPHPVGGKMVVIMIS